MTTNQPLKRRVRARMAETGERYTTARLHVLRRSAGVTPQPVAPAPLTVPVPAEPATPTTTAAATATPTLEPDPRVVERTGRDWPDWYAALDAWGAADRPHRDIARWLVDQHGVDGWWAQELTVRFERACGRRQPGQHADGFAVSVTRTIDAPADEVFNAVADDARRTAWLPDLPLAVRRTQPGRTVRFDVGEGPERLLASIEPRGESRARIVVNHERMADAGVAEAAKAAWRTRLDALRAYLAG